jgi:long-chain acyl-CoA synthetase
MFTSLSMNGADEQSSINHADLTIVFTTMEHIPTLLKLAARTPLKMIVSIDDLSGEAKKILTSWADVLKIQLLEFRDRKNNFIFGLYLFLKLTGRAVEQIGKENLVEPFSATMQQIACICYTSVSSPVGNSLIHI